MPKISVVIPVYNVEKYISQTLESIVNQTFKDIEIICVDDCGNDGSVKIAKSYAEKDSRIKIIKHEKNKGLGAARNTGFRNSSGEFVYFIDSDDYVDESMLEKAYRALKETGFESIWIPVNTYFESKNSFETDSYFQTLNQYPGKTIEITPENINNFPVLVLNKIFLSDFIRKNGLEFPEGLIYEDEEFFYKFYVKSKKTFVLPEFLCVYRRREGSIMHEVSRIDAKREDMCKIAANIYKYFVENGLFETYKESLMNFIYNHMKHYLKMQVYRNRLTKTLQKLLIDINFPKEYAETKNDAYYFLMAVSKYDESKKIRYFARKSVFSFAAAIANLIPFSKTRKKYRAKFKRHYF